MSAYLPSVVALFAGVTACDPHVDGLMLMCYLRKF
jgi:hypothetical protein